MGEKIRRNEKEKEESKEAVQDYEEEEEEEYYDRDYNTKCPDCSSTKLDFDESRGEVSCKDCGLVFEEDRIDHGPEWRAFDSQELDKKSRVGSPTTQTMHDKGLTTKIDWKDKDAGGRTLSSEKKHQMRRLRKRNKRSKTKDPKDKNLQFALSEIDRMCSSLGLPENVKEVASVLYRRALDEDLIRGRSVEAVAGSAIYITSKDMGIPRSLDEVAKVSRIDEKEIGRTKRHISRELNLEVEPSDPKNFVPRFCSELGLSQEVEGIAKKIIDAAVDEGLLSGKSPTGFAAAAIYTAAILADEKRTQKELAEVGGVTEVTIRNQYTEQLKALERDSEDEDENESNLDVNKLLDN